jgi:hypothetical protein
MTRLVGRYRRVAIKLSGRAAKESDQDRRDIFEELSLFYMQMARQLEIQLTVRAPTWRSVALQLHSVLVKGGRYIGRPKHLPRIH